MIRIIFFDIDGTLLNLGEKQLSKRVKDALNQVKKNNILVFAATGRPPYALPKFEGFEFDGILGFNGAVGLYHNQIIYSNPLDKKEVQIILERSTNIQKAALLATNTRMGSNFYDKDLDDYMKIAVPEGQNIIKDFDKLLKMDIYQIMSGVNINQEQYLLKDLKHTTSTRWVPTAVDIIPKNGGKGKGIQNILKHFNFSIEESMAFGDAGNDIDMLQTVGTSIAMGNAQEEVKKIADYITKPVSEDGVYWALKQFNLI